MPKPTYEELQQRVKALEKGEELTFKVGDKGGVSVYGLGRFPVTLYYEQWLRLLDSNTDTRLRKFLEDNKSKLKMRGDK